MVGFLDYVESLQLPPRMANPLLMAEEKILNADRKHKKIVFDAKVFFAAHKHRMNSQIQDGYTGGSYPWLADTITEVVTNLRRHNMEPIVVALNTEKHRFVSEDLSEFTPYIETVRDLEQECPYSLQFPLRHIVISSALLKLNVESLVADMDEDQTIAEIANELGCPVLAMYYHQLLYPVHEGVMFIGGQHYWKYRLRLYSGKDIQIREWNYKEFVKSQDGITADHYALMAAADELDEAVKQPQEFYEKLVESVKENSTDEEMIDKLVQLSGSPLPYEEARLKFVKSWKKYRRVAKKDSESEILITHLRSKEFRHDTKNRRQLPPIYQERMGKNLFPISFWSMLVTRKAHLHIGEEHLNMRSAKLCSRRIRQFSYAILLNFDGPPSGQEYFQIDGDYVAFLTKTAGSTSVSLEEIPDMTVEERRTILLEALDVDTIDTDDLTSETSLLTAAIHFWVKHCHPGAAYQEAMRIDTISYQFDQRDFHTNEEFITPSSDDYSSEKLREILHPIAQFSSILHDAVELSSLLLDPCGEVEIQAVFDVPYLLHTVLENKNENE